MYFIKEVRKEMLDIDAMTERLNREKATARLYAGKCLPIRIVIGPSTRRELICTCQTLVRDFASGKKETFEGCPIDINESLGFGEVLFTMELAR